MTEPEEDPLGDPAMAKLLLRFSGQMQARGADSSLSPRRRAALAAALDEVDAERGRFPVRMGAWRTWLLIAGAAAVLVASTLLVLHAGGGVVPHLTAQVARAEPIRGAPLTSAFTVDVTSGGPGFARIDAFTTDGRRHALPLRDGQPIVRIDARMRFGEFDLPDAWRLLVVFAPDREVLVAAAGQAPERLVGATASERQGELARVAEGLRRRGMAVVELVTP